MGRRANTADDILARVRVCAHGQACQQCCWPWTGAVQRPSGHNPGGEGLCKWQGKLVKVTRLLWILRHGAITEGFELCQSSACTTKSCANLAHYEPRPFGIGRGRVTMSQLSAVHEGAAQGKTVNSLARALHITPSDLRNRLKRYRAILSRYHQADVSTPGHAAPGETSVLF